MPFSCLHGSKVPEDAAESGKTGFVDFKRVVWHKAFEILLATLKQYTTTGCTVLCGDGVERLVVPAILILSADYEEQYVDLHRHIHPQFLTIYIGA